MKPEGIFVAPSENSDDVEVLIDPNSKRLQRLEPFPIWDGKDFVDLPIMVKAKENVLLIIFLLQEHGYHLEVIWIILVTTCFLEQLMPLMMKLEREKTF